MLSPEERKAKIGAVIRVSSGNFLEMYDFIVYSYYATYIARAFFPSDNEYLSVLLSLSTFGAGYLMRPLGALILGTYMDRHGRRAGLLLTLLLMAVGTLTLALTPPYARIGIAAPLVVLAGRLLQGLSAGVELGGVSVYLAEIATPGHRGFYCAWQSGSQQVAVMFTSVMGVILISHLSTAHMADWGWRVPLLIGCLIIPVILWLRGSLEETSAFERRKPMASAELISVLARHWKRVMIGMMLSVLTTTTFYLITAYTPTFGKVTLQLTSADSLVVTMLVGLSNFIWLPIGGAISDRIGRSALLIAIPIFGLLTAYPAMAWLVAAPSFWKLLAVELWFSFFFGMYSGAMIPAMTEIMPAEVRTAGFSLAFSVAAAVFGGFTPAICFYLIHVTNNKAMPAVWFCLAAVIGLGGALLSRNLPDLEAE